MGARVAVLKKLFCGGPETFKLGWALILQQGNREYVKENFEIM